MTQTKIVSVDHDDLLTSFELVSSNGYLECQAYICLDTGRIYCKGTDLDEADRPEDLEDSDRYIALPTKRDLGVGSRLARVFAEQELPRDADTVADIFRRRGAFARFKSLLVARGALERWYAFQNDAEEAALLEWCEESGTQVVGK